MSTGIDIHDWHYGGSGDECPTSWDKRALEEADSARLRSPVCDRYLYEDYLIDAITGDTPDGCCWSHHPHTGGVAEARETSAQRPTTHRQDNGDSLAYY